MALTASSKPIRQTNACRPGPASRGHTTTVTVNTASARTKTTPRSHELVRLTRRPPHWSPSPQTGPGHCRRRRLPPLHLRLETSPRIAGHGTRMRAAHLLLDDPDVLLDGAAIDGACRPAP